jgi:RNase P subunit RPR2
VTHQPRVTVELFPHGVRCYECNRELKPGTPFSEQLSGVVSGLVVVTVVCVPCGLERPVGD